MKVAIRTSFGSSLSDPCGRDRLAEPADDDLPRPDRGLGRQARVDPAVDLADVGEGGGAPSGSGISSMIAAANIPPGRRAAAMQRRDSARSAESASSCRRWVGARTREAGVSTANSRASASRPSTGRSVPRSARTASSSGSRSRPITWWPAPRQVEGDAARPAAELQHRAAVARGQFLPKRQVGPVAAALDVVPDRRRGRVHRQNSFARPRSARSLRSSSRAV